MIRQSRKKNIRTYREYVSFPELFSGTKPKKKRVKKNGSPKKSA